MKAYEEDVALGIIANSYSIPDGMIPQGRLDAVRQTQVKAKCPFVNGFAHCVNGAAFCSKKVTASSSDDCLDLDEDEVKGQEKAIELVRSMGFSD